LIFNFFISEFGKLHLVLSTSVKVKEKRRPQNFLFDTDSAELLIILIVDEMNSMTS